MKPIPLIVGFGGLSAAGRSAFHIAYNRLVIEEIDKSDKLQTFASLAIMMNLVNYEKEQFYTLEKKKISLEEIEQKYGDYIKKNTLLRKIPKKEFAKDSIFQNSKIKITSSAFQQIKAFSQNQSLDIPVEEIEVFLPTKKPSKVMCAGCLPTGFEAANHYPLIKSEIIFIIEKGIILEEGLFPSKAACNSPPLPAGSIAPLQLPQ